MLGVGLAVASAVAFAFTNYYLRLASRDLRQGSVTAWSSITGFIVAILIAVGFGESLAGIDGWGWVSIAGIALVWFIIGRYLMIMGLRLIGLSLTGPMMGTIPIWALLLAFFFLDDQIGWTQVVGVSMSTFGLIVMSRAGR
jgi:drug/metabolite transporter (DMT)-like permease